MIRIQRNSDGIGREIIRGFPVSSLDPDSAFRSCAEAEIPFGKRDLQFKFSVSRRKRRMFAAPLNMSFFFIGDQKREDASRRGRKIPGDKRRNIAVMMPAVLNINTRPGFPRQQSLPFGVQRKFQSENRGKCAAIPWQSRRMEARTVPPFSAALLQNSRKIGIKSSP